MITSSRPDTPQPRVTWVPAPTKGIPERVLRKFLFPTDEGVLWTPPAVRAAGRLIAKAPIDVVLSTIPYMHSHIVGYLLKKRFNLPWIADYRDPIIGNPFRRTKGIPHRVHRFLDGRFFANADLLVAVSDCVRQEWVHRCPEVAAKSAVIWNGYDPEEPIGPHIIPPRYYRVIAHIGSFYGGRTPVVPIASALRLVRRGALDPASFRFRLVGDMPAEIPAAHSELFRQMTSLGCLELLPEISRPQALDVMMESDSLLVADNNRLAIGYTVPAKLFEYLRVSRPVLALTAKASPVERILAMSGVRFVTLSPELDEAEIDKRMLKFLNFSTEPADLSKQFLLEFNGRNQAHTLAGLLDELLDGPPVGGHVFDEEPVSERVEV